VCACASVSVCVRQSVCACSSQCVCASVSGKAGVASMCVREQQGHSAGISGLTVDTSATCSVFMRESQKYALEEELREKVLARIVVIQRWVRAKLTRCRFLHTRRSAIILQSAVRGWRCREGVNQMRLRVCKAVEIQAAWRGFVERKRLIRLKQAAIILQAHWRGRCSRIRYVELREEWKRVKEEERLRHKPEPKEEEEATGTSTLEAVANVKTTSPPQQRHKKQDSCGAIVDAEVSDVLFHFDTIVTELEKSTLTSRSVTPIDPLARTPTPNKGRARELTSPDIFLQASSSCRQEGGEVGGGGREGEVKGSEVVRELPPKSVQPKFKVEDIKQQFLQNAQRHLTTSTSLTPRPHHEMTPSSREKVKNIIAQMQASSSSRETSPSPTPEQDGRDPSPVKQTRQRSSSISQRISMLTQVSVTEGEVFEKKEQPVVASRRISEITHNFELKKQPPKEGGKTKSASGHKRRRSSSASKSSKGDDSPKILSPPKSSKRFGSSHENGLPPAVKRARDASHVVAKYTSREIEEALGEMGQVPSSSTSDQTVAVTQGEDSSTEKVLTEGHSEVTVTPAVSTGYLPVEGEHEQTSVGREVVEALPSGEAGNKDDVTGNSTMSMTSSSEFVRTEPVGANTSTTSSSEFVRTEPVGPDTSTASSSEFVRTEPVGPNTSTTSSSEFVRTEPVGPNTSTTSSSEFVRTEPVGPNTSTGDEPQAPVSVSSQASEGVLLRNESTSSGDGLLSPAAVEHTYRFRSVSDISHHARKLTSYRTEGSLSSGSLADLEGDSKDQTTELHRVPLKTTHGGKKRNVVSVADPTDILTNLHLARYPLEQSSELTQGLGPDDVRRLNNRQRGEERYTFTSRPTQTVLVLQASLAIAVQPREGEERGAQG
ncbi:Unconventional myosin-IXa, partial [Geodia barretti]